MMLFDQNSAMFGDPQVVKNINIYPLTLKEYSKYFRCLNLLSYYHQNIFENNINKLSFLQFCIILFLQDTFDRANKSKNQDEQNVMQSLSRLDFAYKLFDKNTNQSKYRPFTAKLEHIMTDNQMYVEFAEFIAFITRLSFDDISISVEISKMGVVMVFLNIGDARFNTNDFDNLRQIILLQNGINFDYVKAYNPELESKMKVLKGTNDWEYADFEEQSYTLCVIMQKSVVELSSFTAYEFHKLISRHGLLLDYTMYKPLESAGLIKLKKGQISHYLSHIKEKGRYDDLYIDKDEFTRTTLSEFAKEGK